MTEVFPVYTVALDTTATACELLIAVDCECGCEREEDCHGKKQDSADAKP